MKSLGWRRAGTLVAVLSVVILYQHCGNFEAADLSSVSSISSSSTSISGTPTLLPTATPISAVPTPLATATPVSATPTPGPTAVAATATPAPAATATPLVNSTTDVCLGTPTVTPPSNSNLTPAQLRHFVGLDKIASCGAGQVVAVVISGQSSDIKANLATYSAAYGLPAPDDSNFQIVMADGSCNQSGTPLEAHIDVEMVHAIAPKAKVIYSCPSNNSIGARARAIQAAINAGATVVSMSWGQPENTGDMAVLEPVFAANPQVTFFAGSGDSGANLDTNNKPRVAYPAASKYVVAVGAVQDDGNENLTIWPKSGGGVSTLVPRPIYQQALAASFGAGRLLPDISYNGASLSNVELYTPSGWAGAAGTSVASPIAAGVMAITNQINGSPLGDIHAKLYSVLGPATLTKYYRDVTVGDDGLYSTQAGYDLCGGLGVPRSPMLIPLLMSK